MSSFIGHSLAGLTTYAIGHQLQINQWNKYISAGSFLATSKNNLHNWSWLIWLIAIASAPDIDYLIPALKVQHADQTLRITHSFVGVLLVPAISILVLQLRGSRGDIFKIKSFQLVGAGLSHLLLDTLTGVYPKPWLYPFSLETFKLPFGLLPSAGKIELTNNLFYLNLLIELGVLVPLSISLLLMIRDPGRHKKQWFMIGVGLLVSGCFMIWAASLSR
jgi:inner membrane protein